MDFVERVESAPQSESQIAEKKQAADDRLQDVRQKERELLTFQTQRLGINHFTNDSILGQGVRVAILDAGFTGADQNKALAHLFRDSLIVGTFDFIKNETYVYRGSTHGTGVLSCVGGVYKNSPMGLAPKAEFLLARTERQFFELMSEEINWMEAIEWAEKNGADIVNSSLGYINQRYFPEEMDGKTSYITRVASMAAQRGLLIVNSAGNEGADEWKIIGAPADADSVLSVGGISPDNGIHIDFSSYGPTRDFRMKPNVCATGQALVADGGSGVGISFGTSFSSPLVCGFAACVKSMHPDWSGMKLKEEIERSADLYPYFDYAHGFGVPQASYFTKSEVKDNGAQLTIEEVDKGYKISWQQSTSMDEIAEPNFSEKLFYHLADRTKVHFYTVIDASKSSGSFVIPFNVTSGKKVINASYQGKYVSYKIK